MYLADAKGSFYSWHRNRDRLGNFARKENKNQVNL